MCFAGEMKVSKMCDDIDNECFLQYVWPKCQLGNDSQP